MPFIKHDVTEHKGPDEPYRSALSSHVPDEVHITLGRFLIASVAIEHALVRGVRELTGLDDTVARYVVAKGQIKPLTDMFARLTAINRSSEAAAIASDIKKWVGLTSQIRNFIAHQLPDWRPGWVRYHSYETASDISVGDKLLYVVKLSEVENMTEIARRLSLLIYDVAYDYEAANGRHAEIIHMIANLDLPGPPS